MKEEVFLRKSRLEGSAKNKEGVREVFETATRAALQQQVDKGCQVFIK